MGFFAVDAGINPVLRFALTATILAIMTRFFFQSVIAYGFFIRHRYIRSEIEKHWMNKTDIDCIVKIIKSLDHDKYLPSNTNNIVSQFRYGPLGVVLPSLLLIIDFAYNANNTHFYIINFVASRLRRFRDTKLCDV